MILFLHKKKRVYDIINLKSLTFLYICVDTYIICILYMNKTPTNLFMHAIYVY